ncbi:hypothetical protein HDV63DRAFT_369243 [Trichoderma sp. SZMC 28014]
MVNMHTLPTSLSLLVYSILATTSSALHVRPRLDAYPTPVANLPNAAAPATITAAPYIDNLGDLKFARAALPTLPACATSCVASAVTKSTDCKLGDYQCECNFATVINQGAAPCVQSACGFDGALQAQAAGEELCLSVLGGLVPSSTPTNNNNNNPSPTPGSGSSSSKVSSPKPSSSSGGSSGSGSGSNSGSGSGSNSGSGSDSGSNSGSGSGSLGSLGSGSSKPSKKTKLSGGAIAGIVVGVVAGITGAAGAVWRFCLTKMKGGTTAEAIAAAGVNGTNGAPPSGAAVETAQVHPDPTKPTGITSTTPLSTTTTPSELSNNHPHTVSSVSPPYQSPVTPTPPVYPNAAEMPNGSWPQQQQPPAGYVYPPPQQTGQPLHGYQVPGQQQQYAPVQPYPQMHQAYHEAPGAPPPEMAGDTHIVQELHGQTASGGVYEMGH